MTHPTGTPLTPNFATPTLCTSALPKAPCTRTAQRRSKRRARPKQPIQRPLASTSIARLSAACMTLYRSAIRSGDPALYDAAALVAALHAQLSADRPMTTPRIRAALDAARHAYRLDINLRAQP